MTDAAIQPRTGTVAGPGRPTLDSGFDPRSAFVFSACSQPASCLESVPGVSRVCDEMIPAY